VSENEYKYIELKKKGKICILRLNRPEKKNAMSFDLRAEIIDALNNLKDENRIKCVIFYGGEEIFTAGFDRDEVQAVVQGTGNLEKFTESNNLFHHTILGFPKLLIAAINGYALAGGFDLAVLCHLRVASKSAIFGHPEIGFGACPLFFPYMALVGRGKALELTLNTASRDKFINAEEAYRLNIINKLVEPGEVLESATTMAKEILKSPALAVTQLLLVSNEMFNRIKAFDTEIETILKKVKVT
jgi:enoyl-CoA hydratase